MRPRRRDRSDRGRDAAVAVAVAVATAVLLFAAQAGGQRGSRPMMMERKRLMGPTRPLPAGWHQVERSLTAVLLPVQVYAAATYPIALRHRAGACGPPRSVLAEMPPGGVLLQVIEYPPHALDGRPIRVPRLPRRSDRFSWADAIWADYECAGPSFKFAYRQGGHALQAQVWLHRGMVNARRKAQALQILERFTPS